MVEPKVSGWARVIQVILNNYQNCLFLIILILAIAGAVLIGYHVFLAPRYYYTATGPAFLQQTSPLHGSPPPYGPPSPAGKGRGHWAEISQKGPFWVLGLKYPGILRIL